MKARTHGIWAIGWSLVALINILAWGFSQDITYLAGAVLFAVLSAEDSIIAAIKRAKEDA